MFCMIKQYDVSLQESGHRVIYHWKATYTTDRWNTIKI